MKRVSRRKQPSVPVASMGDIAFLLIIFFMVCSNPLREQHVELTPPKAEDLENVKEERVSLSISEEGVIYVQGLPVADAEAAGWAVAALIADKVGDGRIVMFKCDQNIDRTVFEPVIDAITEAGAIIAAVGDLREGSQR